MADERIVFKGNPSPVAILGSLVLGVFALVAIFAGLIYFRERIPTSNLRYVFYLLPLVPLLIYSGKWMALKFVSYEVTSERIRVIRGIFSKRTDELELYRVKDTALIEPFIFRLFAVGNILVVTNDASTPGLELHAIKNAREVREQIRTSIEECRTRKRAGIVELE